MLHALVFGHIVSLLTHARRSAASDDGTSLQGIGTVVGVIAFEAV